MQPAGPRPGRRPHQPSAVTTARSRSTLEILVVATVFLYATGILVARAQRDALAVSGARCSRAALSSGGTGTPITSTLGDVRQ